MDVLRCLGAFFIVLFFILSAILLVSYLPISEFLVFSSIKNHRFDEVVYLTFFMLGGIMCLEGYNICVLKRKHKDLIEGDI
jgi:hypothetical protein